MPDQILTSEPAAGSLRQAPGTVPAPALTRGQALARAALVEAVLVRRPLVLLEGGAGIGKTLVLNQACAELVLLDVPVTRLSGTSLRPAALLQQLGVSQPDPAAGEAGEWLLGVGEQVLAIDDAQALLPETLALLAALLRLRPDGGRVLQVLLVGGAGLLRHVAAAAPELRERAATPLAIAPMAPEEAASYLAGRMQALQAGASVPPRVQRALLLGAGGIPARVDEELARLLAAAVPQPAMVVPAPARPLPDSLRPVAPPSRAANWRQRPGAVGGAAAIGFGVGLLVMGGIVWTAWPGGTRAPAPVALTPWAAPLSTPPRDTRSAAAQPPPAAVPAAPPAVAVLQTPAVTAAPPAAPGPAGIVAAPATAEAARSAAPWWTALPPPPAPRDTGLEDELARTATATSMDRQHVAAATVPPDASMPAVDAAPVPVPAPEPTMPPVAAATPEPASPPVIAATPEPAVPSVAAAMPAPAPAAPASSPAPEPPLEARMVPPLPPVASQPAGHVVPHQVLPGGETVEDVLRHFLGSAGPVSRATFAALNPDAPTRGRLPAGSVVLLPLRRQPAPPWPRHYEVAVPRRIPEPAMHAPSSRPYFCNQIRPLNTAEFAYAREVCGR